MALVFVALSLLATAGSPLRAQMTGMYGPYSMSREASGTSWQPESTPIEGVHLLSGDWMAMFQGSADAVYDRQGGPRGHGMVFPTGMGMVMAQHPLWDGTLGLRGMLSIDPAMGPAGYPLLLQTGETADGTTPLIDRQHPHNFLMELAAAYSYSLDDESSVFAYFGFPGEPALGPPNFMQRLSGMDDPIAPITHHWLDSTHITFGVGTLGYVWRALKLEGSAFNGREPDQHRWGFNPPAFDSFSTRLSWNPSRDCALQASYGRLAGPEQLSPQTSQGRFTASATCNAAFGESVFSQTTFAWGHLMENPGRTSDGFLLESAARFASRHTIFGRLERVSKDDLLALGPSSGQPFNVNEATLGYVYDFARWLRSQWGLGASGTLDLLPGALKPSYGSLPASFSLFARVKLL